MGLKKKPTPCFNCIYRSTSIYLPTSSSAIADLIWFEFVEKVKWVSVFFLFGSHVFTFSFTLLKLPGGGFVGCPQWLALSLAWVNVQLQDFYGWMANSLVRFIIITSKFILFFFVFWHLGWPTCLFGYTCIAPAKIHECSFGYLLNSCSWSQARSDRKFKRLESRKSHSWWWDSHVSPKNSRWLTENLEG